ncbi:hypothetical protein LCGC14_1636770 [marine sediment metagenome]|uniref:Uncharacterized protein n=1 Tax=marine sediment metagenome TaxID=412755 RepID=A0A0F9IN96_9ZZZZ
MLCNKITKPEFTKEQIAECRQCKHASKKKIWCCLFGVSIIETGKIITPDRKIKYPSLPRMGMNFAKATGKHIASGFKKRSKQEQELVKTICQKCSEYVLETKIGPRCKKCGCCVSLKKRWATSRCPLGKW